MISSRAAVPPETTHWSGAFTAARARSGWPARRGSTSSAGADTAAMPPGVLTACISRARAATRVTASGRSKRPATAAATTSPMLCPMSTLGRTPQDIHSLASAYSRVNRAGWVYSVRSIASGSAAVPSTSSATERPRCGANSSSHRSTCSRKTGKRS